MSLNRIRNIAADRAFLAHDFGIAVVKDLGLWEINGPGTLWSRTFRVETAAAGGGAVARVAAKALFMVTFHERSGEIAATSASIAGRAIGRPAGHVPAGHVPPASGIRPLLRQGVQEITQTTPTMGMA